MLKAKRNSAIILSITVITHAYLIKEKGGIVYKAVNTIFSISFLNTSILILVLTATLDLLEHKEINSCEYNHSVYSRLHAKHVGRNQTYINKFVIEIMLGKKYKEPQYLVNALSITAINKYSPLF